jgi:hypothetical protein
LGCTEEDAKVKKAVDEAQEYYDTQDKREWVEWAAKEAELHEKEAVYIWQVNMKEINEDKFWELVGELDLERVMGESVTEGPATMQATTQDKDTGESKWDESAVTPKSGFGYVT